MKLNLWWGESGQLRVDPSQLSFLYGDWKVHWMACLFKHPRLVNQAQIYSPMHSLSFIRIKQKELFCVQKLLQSACIWKIVWSQINNMSWLMANCIVCQECFGRRNTNLQKREKHLFLCVSATTRLAGCFINGDADWGHVQITSLICGGLHSTQRRKQSTSSILLQG
jgi:hypothetical protein